MPSTSRRAWQRERRDDLPLSEVLHVLRGRRLLVVGTMLVLVVVVLLFGLFREPVYTAEATINIKPREGLINDEEEGEAFLEKVRSVVVTKDFQREVRRRAGWEADPDGFTDRLDPQPDVTPGGELGWRVRFSDPNPEQAARAANAYAETFVQRVERLNDERLAGGTLAADASVARKAAPPEGSGSRLLLYAAAAAGAGVLAGGVGALLVESRARSWRDARDAELTLRAPVLGVIPDYSSVGEED